MSADHMTNNLTTRTRRHRWRAIGSLFAVRPVTIGSPLADATLDVMPTVAVRSRCISAADAATTIMALMKKRNRCARTAH